MTPLKDHRFIRSELPRIAGLSSVETISEEWQNKNAVASVLVLFADINNEWGENTSKSSCVILTKRSQKVRSHKGQFCFPGGKKDPTDTDAIDTALREAHEEINAERKLIQIHGSLPSLKTPTGHYIIPIVGTTTQEFHTFKANAEVDTILAVPAVALTREENRPFEFAAFGKKRRSDFFDYKSNIIWGVTAHIIVRSNILPAPSD